MMVNAAKGVHAEGAVGSKPQCWSLSWIHRKPECGFMIQDEPRMASLGNLEIIWVLL